MIANDATKTVQSDGSFPDTNAAIAYIQGKAEDGWTLTIGEPGGEYVWSKALQDYVDFTSNYNFTVQGASPVDRPRISHGPVIVVKYAPGKLVTIKDIIFVEGDARDGAYNVVNGSGPTPGFRYSNVRWEASGTGDQANWYGPLFFIGTTGGGNPTTSDEGPFGLFDNCSMEGAGSFFIYCNNGSTNSLAVSPSWRRPMELGTDKSVYFEDCDFRDTDGFIGGIGITDSFNGGGFVMRRCRVDNIMVANHGSDHYGNHVKGSLKHEIYDNEFRMTQGNSSWLVYLRGGTAAIFDNEFYIEGNAFASSGVYWDFYRANSGAGPANSIYDRYYNPLNTTIAAGSNGVNLASKPFTIHVADTTAFLNNPAVLEGAKYTKIASGSNGVSLPQGTIHVDSTADFPSAGVLKVGTPNWVSTGYGDNVTVDYTGKTATTFTGCVIRYSQARMMVTGDTVAGVGVGEESKFAIYIEGIKVVTSAGLQTVNATGKTATSFTGVHGGTGVMSTGGAVTRASDYVGTQQSGSGTIFAKVAESSNGVALPQGTINVDSTLQFPSSGRLLLNYNWQTGTGIEVTYTGKTATSFTGCAGGTGIIVTGQAVAGVGQDPWHPNEPWGSFPIWQWNNKMMAGSVLNMTSKSVHDFIQTDRDIFMRDAALTKPTNTGTWLDAYEPLEYPHPLRALDTPPAVATPVHTPAGGTYSSAQNVTITCSTPGATIRYTTDGGAPTTSSTLYTGPVAISATTTLRSIASDGVNLSAIRTSTYTISEGGGGDPPPPGAKRLKINNGPKIKILGKDLTFS